MLTERANPSGKLAETWPERLADTPCGEQGFPDNADQAFRRESLYIGYRWYDAVNRKPAFPFGHGLSYTEFSYGNMQVSQSGQEVLAGIEVTNTGTCAGAEVVQVYIAPANAGKAGVFKAPQQLRGFRKAFLQPGENIRMHFKLDIRAFACYDPDEAAWVVEAGYPGSKHRRHAGQGARPADSSLSCYYRPDLHPFDDTSFECLLGCALSPAMRQPRPFTIDSPVSDLDEARLGRFALRIIRSVGARIAGGKDACAMLNRMLQEVPLMAAVLEEMMDMSRIEALIRLLNHEDGIIEALRRDYGKQLRQRGEAERRRRKTGK